MNNIHSPELNFKLLKRKDSACYNFITNVCISVEKHNGEQLAGTGIKVKFHGKCYYAKN